ncbi:MAG: TerB family tellurite resistance protein [Deltaproteobacteria bacterium]|nr:TerB family tellurite resistance protein [Deltaproteobacteria bacterium]
MDDLALERALHLSDLLCGAAAADGHFAEVELTRVVTTLEDLLGAPLPEEVIARVEGFDPTSFDLAATLARLALEVEEARTMMLDAVVTVTGADRFVDSSEAAFVAEVAAGLGLPMPAALT